MADGYIQLPTPADTGGAKIDTTQITRADSTVVQRQRLDVVNRYNQKVVASAVTSTGQKTRVDFSDYGPLSDWGLQVTGIGASATAWTVNLEVSLDGVIFQSIIQHTTTTLNGGVLWVVGRPCLVAQIYVASLTLGTATGINVNAIGT